MRAIDALDYHSPTPIQAESIPPLLEGRDMLGVAQTGTGKTAAFALPVLQRMSEESSQGKRRPRCLVLSPTRELAGQIAESFEAYGKHLSFRVITIFGGVSERPQISALKKGVDIIVACPGRFLDLHGRGFIDVSQVHTLVLDEADRMLDMGFVRPIRQIIRDLPKARQNLLFSATMPKEIVSLANEILDDPVRIEIAPDEPTVEAIDQRLMFVEKKDKKHLLAELLKDPDVDRSIVFTRTKRGANNLVKRLNKSGFEAVAIHGNKSQNARQRALDGFRDGDYDILVATDVASRGIDVDDITHVFNFDLPDDPSSYVHRIGRTGRAGRTGIAISFCDAAESDKLKDVQKAIGQEIPADSDHPFHSEEALSARPADPASAASSSRKKRSGGGNRRRRGGRGRGRGKSGGSGSNRS